MFDRFRIPSLSALRPLATTADLLVVCLYGTAVPAVLAAGALSAPARVALAVPLLVFVPGYAVTAALFPARERDATRTDLGAVRQRPLGDAASAVERFSLSVVLSVLAVAVSGIVADAVAALALGPVALGVAAVTLAGGLVALYRRAVRPASRRFAPLAALADRRLLPRSASGAVMSVGLAVCVLLLAGSAMAAIGDDGGEVTEFYLANETADGDLSTGDYPTTFTAGEARSHYLAVEHEGSHVERYTAVARLAPVDASGDGEPSVGEPTTLDRIALEPDGNGTAVTEYPVRPAESGTYRLTYLLYRGEAPADPGPDSALRSLRARIVVGESA